MQINAFDAETLRRAQTNPDAFSSLMIGATGCCAFFAQVRGELQEELIRQMEHSI